MKDSGTLLQSLFNFTAGTFIYKYVPNGSFSTALALPPVEVCSDDSLSAVRTIHSASIFSWWRRLPRTGVAGMSSPL